MKTDAKYSGLEIAITGIACRVPGANNWREYWNNLKNGKESTHFLTPEELSFWKVGDDVINDKRYVGITSGLQNKELFDASFFDYSSPEAHMMNPVHRFFHECAWEALEDAGYDLQRMKATVGVYAGSGDDYNWRLYSKLMNRDGKMDDFSWNNLSSKDSLASLLSYKLNLKGPVLSVNTTCSTSLVAILLACKGLLLGETEVALAGGITFRTEPPVGNFHVEGMIFSADGHCRTFDAGASGTVPTEGVGVVVLKRLQDAIRDGDQIYAIIKGGAVNNDGNRKVGFTATSVEAQVDCIRKAHRFAKVTPESITYVEAHGTGTRLGDPIEVEALNMAFNHNKEHACALGSVKTNIGHLDTAAGVAGLIKTALSLQHGQIPASLNYAAPNPEIDFGAGPFYVNTQLQSWQRKNNQPLRAGVSSFGIGGTNAHAILEEAPEGEAGDAGRNSLLLTVSAKTEQSVTRYLASLKIFLQQEPQTNLADMCYTLQTGRRAFAYRQTIAFRDREELMQVLESGKYPAPIQRIAEKTPALVFMFPGQGSQYAGMCKDLYLQEPVFRKQIEEGFTILKALTGESFEEVWLHGDEATINNTKYAQPLIFLMEYSLAIWLGSIGIHARYMIGHSIGEYVAACISGVFTFEEALRVVVKRGELMSRVAPGAMLSVPLSPDAAPAYINEKIALAAVNAPEQVVLSGDLMAITALMEQLSSRGIPFVKLHTSHAFHSAMQETIMAEFQKELEQIPFGQMSIPFISNLTGHYISTQLATSPDYWVQHMRKTVQFSQGLETLLSVTGDLLFIEAGAGHTLTTLLKQHRTDKTLPVVNMLRTIKENVDDQQYLTEKLGRLWAMGVPVNWSAYYEQQKRRRISLPTYSFEPVKYPVEVNPLDALPNRELAELTGKSQDVKDWFYRVCWKQADWLRGANRDYTNSQVLIFADEQGLGQCLMEALSDAGAYCTMVKAGAAYTHTASGSYTITPGEEGDYNRLFRDLSGAGITPTHVIHAWCYGVPGQALSADAFAGVYRESGYQSLLQIARNFPEVFGAAGLNLWVIGNGWHKVLGDENIYPGKCTALAAVKVIPQEFQHMTCRAIEITDLSPATISALMKELYYITEEDEIAIRGRKRFVKDFEKTRFSMPVEQQVFREKGTYLITGASGGVGSLMAGFLAASYRANLILLSRSKIKEAFINELHQKGAQVICIQSKITDSETIAAHLTAAEQAFGSIHGIIHAAGMADHGGVILRRSRQDDELVFEPKITGTHTLCKLFANRTPDFIVNCSSGAASLAPFGQVAYVAANIYQDAIAEQEGHAFPVISIEWPPIREIGMAVNAIRHLSAQEQAAYLQHAIKPAEMIQILSAAIYLQLPVSVISKRDFGKIYRNSRHNSKTSAVTITQQQARERPELSSQYKTPETPTEEKLAVLMQQLLGIDRAGIDDAFFELGGDSLKGMLLLRHIRKEFNVDLPLKELFENQTIRKMGAVIDVIASLSKTTVRTSRITI